MILCVSFFLVIIQTVLIQKTRFATMKAPTELKDVKVLVDDGRLIEMIIDGDLMRVETVIRNVRNMTQRCVDCYSVYDRNQQKMLIDNSRILAPFVGIDRR